MIAGLLHARAWRWLAGPDGVRPGLPIAELLAPLPLGALVVLIANDWWWKPSGILPAWLAGKLSDVAGVIVLPLVLTAILALVLRAFAFAGLRVDWSLRRWKLAIAIAVTAMIVVATKLSPRVAAELAARLGDRARIVADPTDLLALLALGLVWWHGRRAIARVPYGRIAWIAARHASARDELADVAACGADPAQVASLAAAVDRFTAGGPAATVEVAVAALRR